METVAVHGGAFHADDVFAVAILKSIYPDLRVVRTRDPKKLRGADARVDVGNKYNHKTKDYDHHQREMAGKRDNGIPYSGVGLIWKHYGRNLVEEDVWRYVDKRLIQNIDAEDNGVRTYIVQGIFPYFIDEMIKSFNPQWPDITMENFDESFGEAVEIAIKVLKAEIERAKSVLKAKKIFLDAVSKSESKDYVILDEYIPNGEVAVEETTPSTLDATPSLTTDKDDYMPGQIATIFGNFFQSLTNFVLKIFGSDENDGNYTETVVNVTSDESGSFSHQYQLDELYRPFAFFQNIFFKPQRYGFQSVFHHFTFPNIFIKIRI